MGISSKELIAVGIKPGQTFGKCLKCDTIEQALAIWNASEEGKSKEQSEKQDWTNTAWEWLCNHTWFENMSSREGNGHASKSEKKRWLETGSVIVNGKALKPSDPRPKRGEPIEIIFFPKGRRITMGVDQKDLDQFDWLEGYNIFWFWEESTFGGQLECHGPHEAAGWLSAAHEVSTGQFIELSHHSTLGINHYGLGTKSGFSH